MTKYSIIQIGSFQYNVEEGKEYTVDKFEGEEGKDLVIKEVLAIGDGDTFEVGYPFLDKAEVTLNIVKQGKGEKVTSRTFKAKSRYRRRKGFRKQVTKFKVVKISF